MSIVQPFRAEKFTPEQLLSVGINVLYRAFHDGPRVDAKRRYQFIMERQPVFLLNMATAGGGQLKVTLSMERSELRGRINFSLFRKLIAQVLTNYTHYLDSGKPLDTFCDDQKQRWVFLPPTFCETELGLNALALAADLGRMGELRLELMFLDPQQFLKQEGSDVAAAD